LAVVVNTVEAQFIRLSKAVGMLDDERHRPTRAEDTRDRVFDDLPRGRVDYDPNGIAIRLRMARRRANTQDAENCQEHS
jgi:hypothetical protein